MLDSPALTGVRSLFPDITVAELVMSHVVPRVPRCYHGPLGRIPLSEQVSADDLPALFSRHGDISAVFHGRDGVLRYIHKLNEAGAAAVLESGATLLFQDGEPFLRSLAQDVPRELGFPKSLVGCSAFLTHKGGGSPWHADTYDNFVIQVLGEKRWWFAPNHEGEHATHNIWPTADGSFATALETEPADTEVVTLRPGSVLFLPRNYWHRTEALAGPCFGVTLGITRPSHLSLILAMLHEQLGDVPALLEPIGPLRSSHGTEVDTRDRLARSVAEVGRRLSELDVATAALQSLEDGYLRLRFRVADGIACEWTTDEAGDHVLSVARTGDPVGELALDADLAAITATVLQQTGSFAVRELHGLPDVTSSVLLAMLRQLVTLGVLRGESADRGRDHRRIRDFM